MLIRDLFVSDVTRDIPPVVYFHEQSADKLAAEVSEYIITGGWPETHPNHRRVPSGIHEQYVRLLTGIAAELDKPGGPELPAAWISGFYGSGKSSFAKLLGLSLDGAELPGGGSLAEAWLQRDTSPNAHEFREAWRVLRQKVDPLAVVFDVGAIARDNEHIHAVAVRQVQRRLGYSRESPVADFELRLERDGEWSRFEETAQATLGMPWASVKDKALAEEDFSLVMSAMDPGKYTDPMSWLTSHGGTYARSESPGEAVVAIRDMLKFRRPSATLFLVVDEVSQYVLPSQDRKDRLRAFAEALGATLHGKAWLLALGQQKIDEESDDAFLVWAKDRFPPKLRVHLAPTNIKDVVHKRLLQKRPNVEAELRTLFDQHRPDLQLYAYGCETVNLEEFTEVYPMLPGQIDLILRITSALRTRSTRAQGDDQAIRGLLQLLGELFRDQRLADKKVGSLVTLDQVYEVQHTALEGDVQDSMARILAQCSADEDKLLVRAAKVVALLELIQETAPTDARLVAQCLFDRVDRGNQLPAVTDALEELRRRNLLGYSEKQGYKLQSSTGEEWERERRDISVPREAISEIVQGGLKYLLETPDRPRLAGRPFPWAGQFSDGRRADDVSIRDPRDDANIRVDFRYLTREERDETAWTTRSTHATLRDRLIWVCGDTDNVDECARRLYRARAMVKKYKPRRESLPAARRLLLQQEENNVEDLERQARDIVEASWLAGKLYFRGRPIAPQDHGATFAIALYHAANPVLAELYPHIVATQVDPSELRQLTKVDLSGASPKFLKLGILELDAGHLVVSCDGVVPQRVLEYIENEGGLSGASLLAHFGKPPFGYPVNIVQACVVGLLRASKVRVQPEGGHEITAIRDAGVRDLFERERDFRRANIFPAGADDIGPQARARICKFFERRLELTLAREDLAIADAVADHFPALAEMLRGVQRRLNLLPGSPEGPTEFGKLATAFEDCIRAYRQTRPTVIQVKRHLEALNDGVELLQSYNVELTNAAIRAVNDAHDVLTHQAAQLAALGLADNEVIEARERVTAHLNGARPWLGVNELAADLATIRERYEAERQQLMQWQGQQVEDARTRVKGRDGFSTLGGEKGHGVLLPFATAATDTTPEAIAPPLTALKDPFTLTLQRAEERANDLLDRILSEDGQPTIERVDLQLRNRELATESDLEALVAEIRERLLPHLDAGARVRLL
jgi:hypothetical protein